MTGSLRCLAAALLVGTAPPAFAATAPATDASPPGCITAASSPAEKAAAGQRIVAALLGPDPEAPPLPANQPSSFGSELGALSTQNVFANLWGRCGLSRRDRSLVTLGILMALKAEDELRFHFPIAIRNGLTRRELEEAIYHASGYAGFPAATFAKHVAEKSLSEPAAAGKETAE